MTRDELTLAAMRHMAEGDSFQYMLTRFGGGRQVCVKDELGTTFLIQVDEEGRFMGRIPTQQRQKQSREETIRDAARRGGTLFDPSSYYEREV